MLRIGLDIGGSKTELVALDAEGRELLRRREPTPHGRYAEALERLAALVLGAEAELGERASVGIGMPGAVSPRTGLVKKRLRHAVQRPAAEARSRALAPARAAIRERRQLFRDL